MRLRTIAFISVLFITLFSAKQQTLAATQLADGAVPGSQPEASVGDSFGPAISDDGRFVTFLSLADDLTPDIPDAAPDVFRFDRQTGEMKLVSDVDLPLVGLRSDVRLSSSSANGRLVSYTADAQRIFGGQHYPTTAFVWRDLTANTNEVPTEPFNYPNSFVPVPAVDLQMAADGSVAYFSSSFPIINPDDTNYFAGLRYYTPANGNITNIWLRLPQLTGTNIPPNKPVDAHIDSTPDGRYAVWQMGLTPFSPGQGTRLRSEIMLYDAEVNSATQISVHAQNDADTLGDSFSPSISDNGRRIVFESRGTNLVTSKLNGTDRNVYLFDLDTQTTILVNTNSAGTVAAGSVSSAAAVSGDGNSTVFFSDAPDLVDGGANETGDLFLRNNQTGEIKCVSTQAQWKGLVVRNAIKPVISSDGEWLLYQTPGSGLFLYQRSLDQNTLITTDCETDPASMTPDAGLVAFTASAKAINATSSSTARNVYVWQRSSGTVELITRRNPKYTYPLPDADIRMTEGGISADGNRFVFRSAAKNLISNQPDAYEALWVRDIALQTNILVAQHDGHYRATGPRPFSEAVISGNGRYVAYLAQRTNLPPEGLALNGWDDVIVHDLTTGVDQLITASRTGSLEGSSNSFGIMISTNGDRVAFMSYATNLTTDASGQPGFYVWDQTSDSIRRMDSPGTGSPGLVEINSAAQSPDGSRVAFVAHIDGTSGTPYYHLFTRSWNDLQPTQLPLDEVSELVWSADSQHLAATASDGSGIQPYLIDFGNGVSVKTPSLKNENTTGISVSGDGGTVAYIVDGFDPIVPAAWNPATDEVSLGTNIGILPDVIFRRLGTAVSNDGRFIAFRAKMNGGSNPKPEYRSHLRIWDRVNDTYTMVDRSLFDGQPADIAPNRFAFSAEGSRLFLQTSQADTVSTDDNLSSDVFYLDMVTQDSDHDGMDDQWEMAYFNTLDRDGSDDFDGDGISDLGEYLAGTVPINSTSVLSVTDIRVYNADERILLWQSVTGKRYRVQMKPSVNAFAWLDRSDVITAIRESTYFIDSPATGSELPATRFYRVVVVQ